MAHGKAQTALYEDDGVSPAYQNGVSRRTEVTYQSSDTGGSLDMSAPAGSYQPGARKFIFVIRPASGGPTVEVPDDSQQRHIRIQ